MDDSDREFDYINVIPLVDIMLVLLTIVLTTSTLIATGSIPLQLPQASKQHEDLLRLQTIDIDQKGAVYLNTVPVGVEGLRQAFAGVDRTTPVLIRADKQLVLQIFVDVLDVVKQLGFTRVSLQTETSS
jgi:biopolymer transport protein ExbD